MTTQDVASLPALEGVQHRFVDLGDDVTIHVADAGPADGAPVMLVHGFPQNWWEWRRLIGPLAADGYRVLCPDPRGMGWSSAPAGRYYKNEMAEDLAAVLDRLGVSQLSVVGHYWGILVGLVMILRHPGRVTRLFGMNGFGPWPTGYLVLAGDLWRYWYVIPMALPLVGPRLVGDPKGRFFRMMFRWTGAGVPPDADGVELYLDLMTAPGHAAAGSRLYRTQQTRELPRWLLGEFAHEHVDIPVRWLHGMADPVIIPKMIRGFDKHIHDFQLEQVDGVGHWIVDQRSDLVLDRIRTFLSAG
jgi:pimeloyl-ACP methyl ester carboxylesterase